jgi:hypothetical protein
MSTPSGLLGIAIASAFLTQAEAIGGACAWQITRHWSIVQQSSNCSR